MKQLEIKKHVSENVTNTLKASTNGNNITLKIQSYDDSITVTVEDLEIMLDRIKHG